MTSRAGVLNSSALPRRFYARPTLAVARDLIGKVLVHQGRTQRTAGIIVEVEAYIGEDDPACHAAPGPTPRNQPLYGEPGRTYVYLNYGVHALINAVTEPAGRPAAVLIRALDPLEGQALMRRRRAQYLRRSARDLPDHALCRGPGNLARALGITLHHNRLDLTSGQITIEGPGLAGLPVAWSARVGIRVGVDRLWRCYARGHAAVSRGPRA